MKRHALSFLAGIALAVAGASNARAEAKSVTWTDLAGQVSGDPASSASTEPAANSETPSRPLSDNQVRIEGFLLPVDREGDLVYEFMLVPYPGACAHTAQPPPEQMIHVFPARPYRSVGNYEPIAVTGRLKALNETTQLFIVDGVKVIESGYALSSATVTSAPTLRAAPAQANPLLSKRK